MSHTEGVHAIFGIFTLIFGCALLAFTVAASIKLMEEREYIKAVSIPFLFTLLFFVGLLYYR